MAPGLNNMEIIDFSDNITSPFHFYFIQFIKFYLLRLYCVSAVMLMWSLRLGVLFGTVKFSRSE